MIEFEGPKVFAKAGLADVSLPKVEAQDLMLSDLVLPPTVLAGEKTMMGVKEEQKKTNPIADFLNELVQGGAAVLGAVTGLTAKESKSYFDSKVQQATVDRKESEDAAIKVALAKDLEEMSRQQSETTALETSKATQKQQQKIKNDAKMS